jgi:hypothetical protein
MILRRPAQEFARGFFSVATGAAEAARPDHACSRLTLRAR